MGKERKVNFRKINEAQKWFGEKENRHLNGKKKIGLEKILNAKTTQRPQIARRGWASVCPLHFRKEEG